MQAPPDFSLFWRHSSLQIASKSQRNNHINITQSYTPWFCPSENYSFIYTALTLSPTPPQQLQQKCSHRP